MAFANKIGKLIKKSVSTSPSLYQSIRCMSSSKLFVGGLSYGTDEQGLKEAFNNYGEVVEARVIIDRESGRSRGFGFVTYTSTEEAQAAITAMDGKDLHGRMIRVNHATDRSTGTRGGFGGRGGYGGGGFGAGGYGGGFGGSRGGYRGSGGGYGGNNAMGGSGGNFGADDSSFGGGQQFNIQDDLLGDKFGDDLDYQPDYANKRA
ncbi:glycine-rich RNA-binding-like protein [Rhynchospora pubera]|uniref:Glycine-rich RNA-binding-like protein n=1 Tax=Rhynchospora pubera TaxID=906938 RepID=A0AAV8FDI6_9POAL|nr:glycine-rich RNA-binding-like protein [Rhynchospora pubera]